jgi:hypothetical protein
MEIKWPLPLLLLLFISGPPLNEFVVPRRDEMREILALEGLRERVR